MKKLRRLRKGLAILLSVAMMVGLMPGLDTMKVSAAEPYSDSPVFVICIVFGPFISDSGAELI